MKAWSLNLLEPSGPHRAWYGTPLPLHFTQPYLYYFSNPWTRMIDISDSFLHVSVHCKSLISQMLLQGTKKTEIAVLHTATC